MKIKVPFFSKKIRRQYAAVVAVLSALTSFYFIVVEVPKDKISLYILCASIILVVIYLLIWWSANFSQKARLNIKGSSVVIKVGDIFKEKGLKVIGFNEYFDTVADDILISKNSLNGQYLTNLNSKEIADLDDLISNDNHLSSYITEVNSKRPLGKKTKYQLGSIVVHGDFLLTAFSHFSDDNRAYLTLKEYVGCMLNFWDEVDRVYAGRSVVVPLMGSGITRFKDTDVQPQELLSLLLWTFKISRVKFKHPANATVLIHHSLSDKINFFDVD